MATIASANQLPGRRQAQEAGGRATTLPLRHEESPHRHLSLLGTDTSEPLGSAAEDDAIVLTPASLLRRHRLSLSIRNALIAVENLVRIAQPLVLGWAINDLLASSYYGLMIFVGQHLGYVLVGTLRQTHETRFIRSLSADATRHAFEPAQEAGERSHAIERLGRIREGIEIEMDSAPRLIHVAFSFVGALLFLGWYDMTLVPVCLVLFVPAVLLNAAHGRTTLLINRELQAEQDREPELLRSGTIADVRRHFETLTHWRSKLSDSEATNFCLMELFILGLLAAVLVHYCLNTAPRAGDVFAVFQYVLLFITSLGGIRLAVGRMARLSDLRRRV